MKKYNLIVGSCAFILGIFIFLERTGLLTDISKALFQDCNSNSFTYIANSKNACHPDFNKIFAAIFIAGFILILIEFIVARRQKKARANANMELIDSGLGTASFVISVLVGLSMGLQGIAIEAVSSTSRGLSEQSAGAMTIGLFGIICVLASLVAIGLGIGGLVQKGRKMNGAILGIGFSVVTVFTIMIKIAVS